MIPAGTGIDWWQQDANTPIPPGWALCNGQTAVWQTGPRAGQSFVTPNCIGMGTQGGDILGGSSSANSNGWNSTRSVPVQAQTSKTSVGSGTSGEGSAGTTAASSPANFIALNTSTLFTIQGPAIVWVRLIKL